MQTLIAATVLLLGQVGDGWSSIVELRTTDPLGRPAYVAPVHATLLPDGRVLFAGMSRIDPAGTDSVRFAGVFSTTPFWVAPPASSYVTPEDPPLDADPYMDAEVYVQDSLFCSGQTLLSDGRVLTAGGTRFASFFDSGTSVMAGMPSGFVRTGDDAWFRTGEFQGLGPNGYNLRWYPSTTRLADGKVLVMNGNEIVFWTDTAGNPVWGTTTKNLGAEIYDPATNAFTFVAAAPDESYNPDYTHAFQLPTGTIPGFDVLMFGEAGLPVLFSRGGATTPFLVRNNPRPNDGGGSGNGVSTSLLPLRRPYSPWGYSNGSAILTGGAHHTLAEHGSSVYDPVADSWLARIELYIRRHHPTTVLLPDGKLAIFGGHDDEDPAATATQHVEYIDPSNGFSLNYGVTPMGEYRAYHTVALLLPDGRVLVAGGRDAGPVGGGPAEKVTLRYYFPPYFAQPRPALTGISTFALDYETPFYVAWTGGTGALSEAVLVGLGSMTHSVDMNQRHVQIDLLGQENGVAALSVPGDAGLVPPGHYMLFVLDQNRAPSYAAIVHVD